MCVVPELLLLMPGSLYKVAPQKFASEMHIYVLNNFPT